MPDPGYNKAFKKRTARGPILRKPVGVDDRTSGWFDSIFDHFRTLPIAWKRLVHAACTGVILAIILSLYLGALSRRVHPILNGEVLNTYPQNQNTTNRTEERVKGLLKIEKQ